MKKTAFILLLIIYGSATIGATAHLHYCMNDFVGWSLFHNKDKKCGKCGMVETDKEGCCKDEHKHFKLKVDHQKSNAALFINPVATPAVSVPSIEFSFQSAINITDNHPTCHAPPDTHRDRLYILYCIFLV
ncbi:MAG: HYC_CC_PP family protein [Chitinophagaceae bacterium]